MKLLPIPLSPLGAPPSLNMWNSELLWRYPSAPPSPLAELKTQMPAQLSTDPRLWNRDDVVVFLRWSEREFDLPKFELDQFQMNGKAICLLSKTDFGERCPGAGDLVHNVLHMLVRDAQMLSRHLPTSPLTPTSRYPLSPQSHPPTPNWSALPPPDSPFYAQHFQHFMAPNSVTLSPAPSNDSQAGSPPQEQVQTNFSQNGSSSSLTSNSTTSTNSDSDEDPQFSDVMKSGQSALAVNQNSINNKPNNQPTKHLPPPLILEPKILSAWTINDNPNGTLSPSTPSNDAQTIKREFFPNIPTPSTPSNFFQLKREFFPESPEPNTNGRLLWDFLQQLLNDPQQRYSTYIAWKCRDTGVFKIVDPAGLAKLWGIQKNHLSMNYDKMSRALRYYYRVNILRKVQGERHCYQFLRNPTELKSIKNISLLRQTMANQGVGARDSTQIQQSSQPQSSQLQYRGYVKQEQVLTGPPQSPSYNGSISHSSHYSSLTSIPVSSTSATNGTSPVPPAHPVNNRIPKSPVQSTSVKLESNELETDDKPTDLSTNSDRKFTDSNNCFPLIRNSNGLTTIQILRHDGMSTKDKNEEKLRSPSPQLQAALHIEKMDDMPTDLSKNEVTTYNNYR